MLDLHTHSTYSDGSDSPSELAQKARARGLRAISLTDHDTTASYEEMARACATWNLELIPGVEVSLRDSEFLMRRGEREVPRSVHLLAYFLPLEADHPLQQQLERLRADRDVRNHELTELLQQRGFGRITMEYLAEISGGPESIGRPHFAKAMFDLHPEIVGERTDERWDQVFIEWLGSGGRAYIPKTSTPIEDFVASAKGSSTVFSIAHPLVNYLDGRSNSQIESIMPRVLNSLRERGIYGAEAYYGSVDQSVRKLMVKLVRDAGMIPTGGSDYHGHYKENVALGVGKTGDLCVPDEILAELKAARTN